MFLSVSDDIEPLCDDLDFGVRNRDVSAVHVKVYRKALADAQN